MKTKRKIIPRRGWAVVDRGRVLYFWFGGRSKPRIDPSRGAWQRVKVSAE